MRNTHPKNQQGTVIVIALIFLLLTGLISITAVKTSIFETKMASNEQLKEEAFQTVQGVVNAISADIGNFVVAGDIGYRMCAPGVSGCDANTIVLDSITTKITGSNVTYDVTRLAPLFAPIPFRATEDNASSAKSYSAALFEINAEYDGSQDRLGQAAIAQGVAIKVANAGQ